MSKLFFVSVSLIFISTTFSSCNKCKECHYDDLSGSEVEIGEICGDDLKEAEQNGYALGDTVVTLHCEEH